MYVILRKNTCVTTVLFICNSKISYFFRILLPINQDDTIINILINGIEIIFQKDVLYYTGVIYTQSISYFLTKFYEKQQNLSLKTRILKKGLFFLINWEFFTLTFNNKITFYQMNPKITSSTNRYDKTLFFQFKINKKTSTILKKPI
ncbi:hypothetical protein BpHYR1_018483 [Brachionus plicatilis]|uniref:Uncharacterized protein n=1 Tax=Brachionus plicatilis TaxID=10195 RepID=A0A3M7PZF9_BRAPC|nr:hypothetical protein BpHYR1_018483 [Brachionus plicatilis]